MLTKLFHSKTGAIVLAYILVACIAVIDYRTGYELSTSILYMMPIYFIASRKETSHTTALSIALVCSIAWFFVEFTTGQPYSNFLILYWNSLVRAIIFFAIAFFVKKLVNEQQKLKQMNDELYKLNVEKNKYIGIAAHDLRSPIGNIYNLSDLVLDDKSSTNLNKTQREFISLINKISNNALSLLDNLLDVAQIEAGTLKITKSQQNYLEFVDEIIEVNQLIADKKEQQISLQCSEEQIKLSFDRSYLGQVLNNLLTNALKYSLPQKEVFVKISLQDKYVKTEIVDQGMGIREQDKDKIFRPFEKAQNVPTGGERSSGLGLAIVRKIIEAHQGEIGFSSTYGKGSNFYFFLPNEHTAS